ncbi:hypothetical protein L9F63_018297, partial [Diploptera punctata]
MIFEFFFFTYNINKTMISIYAPFNVPYHPPVPGSQCFAMTYEITLVYIYTHTILPSSRSSFQYTCNGSQISWGRRLRFYIINDHTSIRYVFNLHVKPLHCVRKFKLQPSCSFIDRL